jgi:hypothetical protein
MSRSRSGKLDTDLEGVELLFHQKGGSAGFGTKMAPSLNGVHPGCMNPITGSTCRAKCSNILHDKLKSCFGQVFNFRIGCFVVVLSLLLGLYKHPYLELKTRPGVCPVDS